MSEILLDEAETRRRLTCSRSTFYALTASGLLPSVRLGRALRVPESALADFVAAGGTRVIPKRTGRGHAKPKPKARARAR